MRHCWPCCWDLSLSTDKGEEEEEEEEAEKEANILVYKAGP